MTLSCSACGLSSRDRDFFRRERCGLFGLPQPLCEGCAPHRLTPEDRRERGRFIAGQLLWMPVIWAGFQYGAAEGASMIMALAASIASLRIRVGLHEMGHALAAKVVGVDAITVVIGSGPRWRSFRLARISIELRRYGFGGGHTLYAAPTAGLSRLATAAILVSGSAANLASAALAMLLSVGLDRDGSLWAQIALAIVTGFLVSSAWIGLTNLLPFKTRGERVSATDGWLLLQLIRRSSLPNAGGEALARAYVMMLAEQYREAADVALAAAPSSPHGLYLWSNGLHALARSVGDRAAVDCYLANEAEICAAATEEDMEKRRLLAWIKGTAAWSALRTGDSGLHGLADRMSKAALSAVPDAPELQATRGAWMVADGQVEAGVALLCPAVRAVADPRDKADFCHVLARAFREMNDARRADGFAALHRHLLSGLPAQ